MNKKICYQACLFLFMFFMGGQEIYSQKDAKEWNKLPIKALLLAPPEPGQVESFCHFIRDALPKESINTLVVRFKYRYKFESHPELADTLALSKSEVKQIVQACKDVGVRLIPKMNLLGHQSEGTHVEPLLIKYPEFDESPGVDPPVPWVDAYPQGGFLCKSLCPQHPDIYKILFPLMDELIDVCEADAFHVGLDEVWIIAHEKCPRCFGGDRSAIYAEHVRNLYNHLKSKSCEMWMWGDRLIDGKTTGLGAWQASLSDTHRAIDLIPKDIMICDWKYEDAPPTPEYFAMKGFNVLVSTFWKSDVAIEQLKMLEMVRKNGARESYSPILSSRMQGIFATSWEPAENFINTYYGRLAKRDSKAAKAFKTIMEYVRVSENKD